MTLALTRAATATNAAAEPQAQPGWPDWSTALMQDLIDALWLEGLYDFPAHCRLTTSAASPSATLDVQLAAGLCLRLTGRAHTGLRPFRLASVPALLLHADTPQPRTLTPLELVAQLQQASWWQDRSGRFLHFFELAYHQARASAEQAASLLAALDAAPGALLQWERLSTLKDRPFHPLARAKHWEGADEHSVAAYLPGADRSFALYWIAMPRARLHCATPLADNAQPLAEALLDAGQRNRLEQRARTLQIDPRSHLWLPVHPWQWQWLHTRQPALLNDCTLLERIGSATSTASLRSLMLPPGEQVHLKLSLAVNTLGAIRTLPPRYLHNAVLAAGLLDQLRTRDAWLGQHLMLCEETEWWAAATSTAQASDLIGNRGDLACLIRRYPALPGCQLIPMSALPVCRDDGTLPVFTHLLGGAASAEQEWQLFARISALLVGTGLRCLQHGVLPEMHGQNLLLVCRDHAVEALLLRDHDTLRICPPRLRQQGLPVPPYQIDRSTPNTLELDDLQDLLAYFQTLAIEVNLYALLAALAQRHGVAEGHGWAIVRQAIVTALDQIDLSVHDRQWLQQHLLAAPQWPFKQVLAPLLARPQFGTGMPSSMGRIANPLRMEASA